MKNIKLTIKFDDNDDFIYEESENKVRELVKDFILMTEGRIKMETNEMKEYVRNNRNKIRQVILDYKTTQ